MPVDLAMGLPLEESRGNRTSDDYVAGQQEAAEQSYRLVRGHLQMNSERRKTAYDTRVKKTAFEVGRWVWYYYSRSVEVQQKIAKVAEEFCRTILRCSSATTGQLCFAEVEVFEAVCSGFV